MADAHAATKHEQAASGQAMQKEAKRNPELYVG